MDAMLESAEAGQLQGWQAYYELEPFGEAWRQMSTATANLCNEIRIVSSGLAQQDMKEKDLMEDRAFVPGYVDKRQEKENKRTFEAMDSMTGL